MYADFIQYFGGGPDELANSIDVSDLMEPIIVYGAGPKKSVKSASTVTKEFRKLLSKKSAMSSNLTQYTSYVGGMADTPPGVYGPTGGYSPLDFISADTPPGELLDSGVYGPTDSWDGMLGGYSPLDFISADTPPGELLDSGVYGPTDSWDGMLTGGYSPLDFISADVPPGELVDSGQYGTMDSLSGVLTGGLDALDEPICQSFDCVDPPSMQEELDEMLEIDKALPPDNVMSASAGLLSQLDVD